jgi:DNA-binding XRE family transcriptional regulator
MNNNVTKLEHLHEFVPKLVQLRKSVNITQNEIAKWIGISRKKVINFEKGNFDFNIFLGYVINFDIENEIIINF